MKKLLLIGFLLPILAFTGTDWVNLKMDERFSVLFPSEPVKQSMDGSPLWVADIDSNSRVMGLVMDFTKFGVDSATLKEEMDKPGALEEFRVSLMSQIEGATLISEKVSTTLGYTTFEYVIDMGNGDQIMYNKNIFVGVKMYSLSYYEMKKTPSEANKNKFFNSVRIN